MSESLLAWRPNLIQILISEIQNILELEALATEDKHLRDPVTQTALWYYLLDALGPIDPAAKPDVRVPLMGIIDKIVDGIRRKLSTDPNLLNLASQALLGELNQMGLTPEKWPKPRDKSMLKASTGLARTDSAPPDVMFRLNSFFSTEHFRRAHLTTGTVFHHPAKDQFFVAASPACDLVARKPTSDQAWTHSIFPLTPLVAILLQPVSPDAALNHAANGLHVFLESGDDKRAFKVVAGTGEQPSYEFFMVKNEGRVRDVEGLRCGPISAESYSSCAARRPGCTLRDGTRLGRRYL